MKVIRKLLPGQAGTKKFLRKYGEDLVCVRYRYDEELKIKAITIELIVDRFPWQKDKNRIPVNKIVSVSIDYGEVELGKLVKSAGGKWNKKDRVWELTYKDVLDLGLVDRVVEIKSN